MSQESPNAFSYMYASVSEVQILWRLKLKYFFIFPISFVSLDSHQKSQPSEILTVLKVALYITALQGTGDSTVIS